MEAVVRRGGDPVGVREQREHLRAQRNGRGRASLGIAAPSTAATLEAASREEAWRAAARRSGQRARRETGHGTGVSGLRKSQTLTW